MKTLYVIRHAKSSWDDASLSDDQRPLNKRGKRDAPDMAERLHSRIDQVDALVSSTALRAAATARVFAEEFGIPEHQICFNEDLYLASVDLTLEIVSRFNDDWGSVAIFGHNPGFTSVINYLCGTEIDNVPTCGVAEIGLGNWSSIQRGTAQLLDFDYPKKVRR